jgi:SOS response regulatory protein OraA/RecX
VLFDKLCRQGFSSEVSGIIVDEMVKLSYIDEDRILKRLILNEASVKLSGKKKIVAKLLSKGFSREKILCTLSLLCESGEIDFDEIKDRLIEKKLGENADSEAVKALLYKYGY